MVEIDGMKLVQSRAILNYIATKYNLYGKDVKERALYGIFSILTSTDNMERFDVLLINYGRQTMTSTRLNLGINTESKWASIVEMQKSKLGLDSGQCHVEQDAVHGGLQILRNCEIRNVV